MASPTHGHEFEQAPGVGDGQESLTCCSQWGRQEPDMTEQMNCQFSLVYCLYQYKEILCFSNKIVCFSNFWSYLFGCGSKFQMKEDI